MLPFGGRVTMDGEECKVENLSGLLRAIKVKGEGAQASARLSGVAVSVRCSAVSEYA